jgi:hypothetical protein
MYMHGLPREAMVGLDAEKRMEVAHFACFVFLGYAQAYRGEEISKIKLTRILKHFEEGGTSKRKHVNNNIFSLQRRSQGPVFGSGRG